MAGTQVVDGGGALQIWRGAVNILNKESKIAYKGKPPALGLARG
jgi:hypothetical protein